MEMNTARTRHSLYQNQNISARSRPSRRPSSSATTFLIQKSSRFIKHRDQIFKRRNPCSDDTVFNILWAALRTNQVKFRELFRFATNCDYALTALGILCGIMAAIFYVATIHSFGMFYEFFYNQTSSPCLTLVVDRAVLHVEHPYFWFTCMLILFSFLQNVFLHIASSSQCQRVHQNYVESIARKDPTWFDINIDRDLSFRIRKDMEDIRVGIGDSLGRMVFFITSSILMIGMSFDLNWRVAVILLSVVPIFTLTSVLKLRAAETLIKEETRGYKPANDFAASIFEKVRLVKTFCGEEKAVKVYASSLGSEWDLRKPIFLRGLWASLCWLIPMLCHPFFIWIHHKFLDDQRENTMHNIQRCNKCGNSLIWVCPYVPEFAKVDTVVIYITFAVYFLSNVPILYSKINKARFVAAEVFFCIDWDSGVDSLSEGGHVPREVIGEVQMKDVDFNFPFRPQVEVLKGVSLTAHPGQMISIFGAARCGKTTILRLLLRKYDPCAGTILLDGMELHTLNTPWLRSHIGYVSQLPILLNGTIEENLCGPLEPKPIMGAIIQACRNARVLTDIQKLPQGFKTMVGSMSEIRLSTCILKKLYLARVFLRKCRVILLDDFFATMGPQEEADFLELFESMRKSITLISTTEKFHELMRICDTVYIMKEGQIVQYGNHDNISKIPGYYLDLLQETLQEPVEAVVKPPTDSQRVYYKYANAITSIHDLHDQDDHYDYSKLYASKKVVSSVLLGTRDRVVYCPPYYLGVRHNIYATDKENMDTRRHHTNNHEPLEPARLVGGYYMFVNFYTAIEENYERKLLRNKLVHKRDLRTKIVPEMELDGYPRIRENLLSKKRLSEQTQDENEHGHSSTSVSMDATFETEGSEADSLVPENVIDMIIAKSNNQPKVEYVRMSLPEAPLLRKWKLRGLSRLQHYFGWTKNCPVDTESIHSQDSYRFWNAYINRLQLSNKRYRDPLTIWQFLKLGRHAWPLFLVAFASSCTMGLCLVFSVTQMWNVEIVYLSRGLHDAMYPFLLKIVLSACLAFVAVFIQELVMGFGLCSVNKFRIFHFASILEQDMIWFDRHRNDIANLCEFLGMDMMAVISTISEWIMIGSESAVIVISVVVVVLVESKTLWLESLSLLLIIPFLIGVNFLQGSNERRKIWLQRADSEILMNDMLANINDVIAQGLSRRMLHQYQAYEFRHFQRRTFRNRLHSAWSILSKNLIFAFSQASFLLAFSLWSMFCRDKAKYTQEEAGYFQGITYLMLYGFFPMGFALVLVSSFQLYADSSSFMLETGDTLKKKIMRPNKLSLGTEPRMRPPSITFTNVTCMDATDPEVTVLRNLNFVIHSGEFVAIVGHSYRAKFAILYLLTKLTNPNRGNIFINETSYEDLKERTVRQLMSVVTQDPDMFDEMSIAENIAYGNNFGNVSESDIIAAGKTALIHHIIDDMPDKYETKVEDLPVNPDTFALRQRIAIARAAVRNPKVVIVDEMTVSVEDRSDHLLMKALMKLRKGRTFIVISRRIQPIRKANNILVLKDGTLAEMGTDRELLERKGLYFETYMSQQLYERSTEAYTPMSETAHSVSSFDYL